MFEMCDFVQIQRLLGRSIGNSYDPTIEDRHRVSVAVEDSSVDVEIIDTSGRELFPGMRKKYCEIGDGCVVVYSVKSRRSLREAIRICHLLEHRPVRNQPILMGLAENSRRSKVWSGCFMSRSKCERRTNCGRSAELFIRRSECHRRHKRRRGLSSFLSPKDRFQIFEEIVDQVRYVSHLKKKELRRPPCCFL